MARSSIATPDTFSMFKKAKSNKTEKAKGEKKTKEKEKTEEKGKDKAKEKVIDIESVRARRKNEIIEFFFGKISSKTKSTEKATEGKGEAKLPKIDPSKEPLIKNKAKFRSALRTLDSVDLEIILYGNNTDPIKDTYVFPSEESILEQFQKIEDEHGYFDSTQEEAAGLAFIQFFKIAKIVGDFIENNNDETNSVAFEHAYKMLVIFYQDPDKILKPVNDYLNAFMNTDAPLHDALIYPIPSDVTKIQSGHLDLKGWQALIQKNGPKATRFFGNAFAIQKHTENGGAPQTIEEATSAAKKAQFRFAFLFPELAELCVNYGVSEKIYETCLNIHFRIKGRTHEEIKSEKKGTVSKEEESKIFKDVPPDLSMEERQMALDVLKNYKPRSSDHLPDEVIDGSMIGKPGYVFMKLPKNDHHAYLLGQVTNCCQSIGGASEQCVIDGINLENNGFYVLLKAKSKPSTTEKEVKFPPAFTVEKDEKKINYEAYEIVGQGYTWLSKDGNLVFDSWENRTPTRDDQVITPFLEAFSKKITQSKDGPMRVSIGKGGKTPKVYKEKTSSKAETILTGTPYGDSIDQSEVYCNKERRNEYITQLTEVLDSLLESKIEASYTSRQKQEFYAWITDGYSNNYFKEMKELLLDPSIDISSVLKEIMVNEIYSNEEDALVYLKKIIMNFKSLQESKRLHENDIRLAVLKGGNASTLCRAVSILEEHKMQDDKELRASVLNSSIESFLLEEHLENKIKALNILKVRGLYDDVEIKSICLELSRYRFGENLEFLTSEFAELKKMGLNQDERIREYVFDRTRSFLPDFSHEMSRGSPNSIISKLKQLEAMGLKDDKSFRDKTIEANPEEFLKLIHAHALLTEAKLISQPDFHSALLSCDCATIDSDCEQLIAAYHLLESTKLENDHLIRSKICQLPNLSLSIAEGILRSLEMLREAKRDTVEVRSAVINYGHAAPEQTERIIAELAMLDGEKLTSDIDLRKHILNVPNWIIEDKTNKNLINAISRLKSLGLDQDLALRKICFDNPFEDHTILETVLTSLDLIKEAGIEINKEVRDALIGAGTNANQFAMNIIRSNSLLKETKLEFSSTIYNALYVKNLESSHATENFVYAIRMCQNAGIHISAEICQDLLHDISIAVLIAQQKIKSFKGEASSSSSTKDKDLISIYQEALKQLEIYIEEKNKSKETPGTGFFASHGVQALIAANQLHKTILNGESITLVFENNSSAFENDDELLAIFNKLQGVIEPMNSPSQMISPT